MTLTSSQLNFFPNHSHEDPSSLEGFSLAAEIPPGETIRFGGPGAFGVAGSWVRVGHHDEELRGQLSVVPTAICIQSWWRGTLGRRKAAKRKWAAQTIRR